MTVVWPENGLLLGCGRDAAVEVHKVHILKGFLSHSKWFSLVTEGNSGPKNNMKQRNGTIKHNFFSFSFFNFFAFIYYVF